VEHLLLVAKQGRNPVRIALIDFPRQMDELATLPPGANRFHHQRAHCGAMPFQRWGQVAYHAISPVCRPALASTCKAKSSSGLPCKAETQVLNRGELKGTAGNTTGTTNNPAARQSRVISRVNSSFVVMTGTIAVSVLPVSKPSFVRPRR